MESCVLARAWLQSRVSTVKEFAGTMKEKHKTGIHKKGIEGSLPQPDSYKSIAKFLSQKGKAISYVGNKAKLRPSKSLSVLIKTEKNQIYLLQVLPFHIVL